MEILKDSILNHVFQRLAEGYRQQVPYYRQMLEIAQKQAELLQQKEVKMDLLFEYINERQGLIDTLEGLSEGINALKQEIVAALEIQEFNLNRIRERVEGVGVDALTIVIDELGQLLQQIKELDGQNEDALRRAIEQTRQQLQNVQEAKKVQQAYQGEPKADGGAFIDYSK
ncbi:MAG TPA: flagellar export chaperone FlgN [Peptococcaceae bacterium]|nr:flagellar protein FlgN [Clostridia bacterium]HOB82067.1 flagellar export chaperone FlgN [Peptococcaceae bacterium]HPZ71447.1 flagellar export chaperone FlgN [Peptococcaceae bacterium]HQD54175.1 flagellar export chaperone FlgN [Peptococcaceae bacterium]